MRRVLGLCLLALLAWLVTVVVRFPAAPVVDRLRPQLGPVALEGVGGALLDGQVARVRSTDDLLPLEFRDVRWTFAPGALATGTGANVSFRGYGGGGDGQVLRTWGGDIVVEDLAVNFEAKALEPLLPVPIAAFSGDLIGDIARVVLEGGLLTTFEGELLWRSALIERPVRANLGNVDVDIEKEGEESHRVVLTASGGEVSADGTITLALDGDFVADLLITPAANASAELMGVLGRIARPEAGGKFRLSQSGNVNRLM